MSDEQEPKNILAEDHKVIREIYQLKFEFSGFDIDVMEDELEVIRIIKKNILSIVLSWQLILVVITISSEDAARFH